MIRLFLFVLFSLFFVFKNNAQNITVLSESSYSPIPNVSIYNNDKSKSTITDAEGKADISVFSEEEIIYFTHVSHVTTSFSKLQLVKNNNNIVYLAVDENTLSEVVISVSKWEEETKDITQKIVSISSNEITIANPQTSADLLESSGQVFVQKSQLGGGSPIIRGFSTNRLLLTVDGVRMNNAIFRGGNIQNVISVDPFTIERTEVILGPGSVVYGSDAVGGVMKLYTTKPQVLDVSKRKFKGNALARYASASEEKSGHIDFNIGLDKWAFFTSVSYTDFDDLKMGSRGSDDYLRLEYVETINGKDIVKQNKNPEKQVYTGYDQINFLQKIRFVPNANWDIDAGFIYTTTTDYPRYDRLIRYSKGVLKSAEWYYGPQRWIMGNIQVTQKSKGFFYDKMQITSAYQKFEESRNDRNFGKDILQKTEEEVDALSLNLDFETKFSNKTALHYGGEYVFNKVGSRGSEVNIKTNELSQAASRYPDGSKWQSFAVYYSLKHKVNEKLRLQTGLRYNQIILNSIIDTTYFKIPFTKADINTGALTGTAGISWLPNNILHWKLNFSTAFRSPNVDDVGKIFDSEPGSVVVPNSDLKNEYAYNGELGLRASVTKNFTVDVATYYTYLTDALVRRDFSINGQKEIVYKGEKSNVQAIQNAAFARVYGIEAGIRYNFLRNLLFTSQYTYVGGEEELDNGDSAPSRHVSPEFANAHLIYKNQNQKLTLDAFVNYNGELKFGDLSPSEQSKDYLYAKDEDGKPYTPLWYTLNIRGQYRIIPNVLLTLAVENISDQRYRSYSSGIAAAGRNFIFSLKYSM